MRHSHQWYTQSGTTTKDNRDFCGIKFTKNHDYYLIADGSTSDPTGGKFAQLLVNEILDLDINLPTDEIIVNGIKSIYTKLRLHYPTGSASFLLTIISDHKEIITCHAGDCLLGRLNNGFPIEWLISPHSQANAIHHKTIDEIARCSFRHCLTRSFRCRKFIKPEFNVLKIRSSDILILASDGFWADLSTQDQLELISTSENFEKKLSMCNDDNSFLILMPGHIGYSSKSSCTENIVRRYNNYIGKEMGKKIAETKEQIPI